jgi:hypothetical protein
MTPHLQIKRTTIDKEARAIVEAFHYSHQWPCMVEVIGTWHADGGLFGDSGPVVAACLFGYPISKAWNGKCYELLRLVKHPNCDTHLTGLISHTMRWTHKLTGMDLFVAYADITHGHHGGIYQAASWNYHGQTTPRDAYYIINGERVHTRTVSRRYGTRSVQQLKQRGLHIELERQTGKHLYWKSLTKSAKHRATSMGLQSNTYPKPHNGETQ